MPELITHSVFAYLFRPWTKRFWIIFLVGAILPDVLSRLPMLFLSNCVACSYAFLPSHAPFFLVFVCLLIAFFFSAQHRWPIFVMLFVGALSHDFLDVMQRHIVHGVYPWFFPLSFLSVELGLFWSDASVYVIPFSILVFCGVFLYQRWRN